MNYVKANLNSKYLDNLMDTMYYSFPDNERLDINVLLNNNKIDTYILLDEDKYIGFMTIADSDNYSYLYFLAIDSTNRSKGYGSKALEAFKDIAKDKTRLIDLDLQDDRAEDSINRKRRKDFYLRNGYYDINLRLDYLDMELELISSKQERPNLDEVTYILRNTIKDDLIVDYKELSND